MSISMNEQNLFQIVCSVAWSDGEFSQEERELLSRLIQQYSTSVNPAEEGLEGLHRLSSGPLRSEEWEQLVHSLGSEEDRELALKLSYMMIRISAGHSGRSGINRQEKIAYRRLVDLLALPVQTIEEIEWAAEAELGQKNGILEVLSSRFRSLFGAPL
jgi:hypothetical protein